MHGLIYVFIIPPWQHYDEPNHFEYAWLLANNPWPITDADVDLKMRDDVLASMVAYNFFAGEDPNPGWVLISQYVDPPLYHFLAGVPVRIFPDFSVTDQLYMMRLISLIFLLVCIASAWGAAAELTRPGNPLRWMTPLFLALLPGFVDLMTAVNNDTLAVAFCCLFFWIAVRTICRGLRWSNVLSLLLVAFLAFFTKKTAWILGLFVPLVLLIGLVPAPKRWLIWAGGAAAGLISLVVLLQWGDARNWFRQTEQPELTRAKAEALVDFPYAFQLQAAPGALPALWQYLPSADTVNVRGKTVTVGGWVWASRPLSGFSPGVVYHGNDKAISEISAKPLEISQAPQYISLEVQLPEKIQRVLIVLNPLQAPLPETVKVYYSGLFMVEGSCPVGEVPRFSSPDGSQGTWCGRPFHNLVRNGNATDQWPAPRSAVFNLLGQNIPVTRTAVSEWVAFFMDREGFKWYDSLTSAHLFDTFWAKFGWGHVPLLGRLSYILLEVLTILAAAGAVISAVFERDMLRRKMMSFILFILFFGITGWVIAFVAGIFFGGIREMIVIPVARYAYPVIIPTALVMTLGWWEWFKQLSRRIPSFQNLGAYLYLLMFIFLDFYALASIAYFYYWVKPT